MTYLRKFSIIKGGYGPVVRAFLDTVIIYDNICLRGLFIVALILLQTSDRKSSKSPTENVTNLRFLLAFFSDLGYYLLEREVFP